jgi:hypothetical protein
LNYLADLAQQIRREVPAALVPNDADDLFVLYAVLARAKGAAVTVEDVHDAWVAWMTLRGERHESMRAFAELPADIRAEDEPFTAAIRHVAKTMQP